MRLKGWITSLVAFAMIFSLLQLPASAATNSYQIEINKKTNKLYLYKNGSVFKTYSVATGRTADLTPEGTFTLVVKINMPGWKNIPGGHPDNPLGEKWLGFSVRGDNGRTYGIHGTNKPSSIGTNASSGCIRVGAENLRELYSLVPEGTPVWIHSGTSTGKWNGNPDYAVSPASGKVKVSVNLANVRSGPSQGAFIITQVKNGATLDVIGKVRDWYKIRLSNGKEGYIFSEIVTKVSSVTTPVNQDGIRPASGTIKVTVDVANLRANPSTSAAIIQKLPKGLVLNVTGEGKDWYQIKMRSGALAYIHKSTVSR